MLASAFIRLCVLIAIFLTSSVPAWAGVSDRVKFEIAPKTISKIIERVEGETTLLVASNSAFNISAIGIVGTITVTIEKAGNIGGTNFGSASQLPGDAVTETFLTSSFETPIYRAERKTARSPGAPIDQAVMIRVTYAGVTHPKLVIEPAI